MFKGKKIKRSASLKTKIVVYTIISVLISISIICSVLMVSLFKSQHQLAETKFIHIGSKYSGIFQANINNVIDYLSIVERLLEFYHNEGTVSREFLQKSLFGIIDLYQNIYSSVVFYNVDGEAIYLREPVDNDLDFLLYGFAEVKTKNAPVYTSSVFTDLDGNKIPIVYIIFPLHDRHNNFIGAVTAGVCLDNLYTQLKGEEILHIHTGNIAIVNDKRQIIFSHRFLDVGIELDDLGFSQPLPDESENVRIAEMRSPVSNKNVLLMVKPIYFPQLGNWFYICVSAHLDEIDAGKIHIMTFTVVFSVINAVIIALFLYYLIGVMLKPISEFKEAAEKIAKDGDYSLRIKGEYKNEFGLLKTAANVMLDRINVYMRESANSLDVLKNILNGIDTFIYVSEPKTGKILFINEQMKKAFNIKGNEAIGKYCFKIIRGLKEKCVFCRCDELEKEPDKAIVWEEHDYRIKRDIRHTDLLIDWPGYDKVYMQSAIDITDIKRISQEKHKAEETSRMKSAFLANMSHEIRTPMHGIIGFSELALDDNISPSTRNYLTKIKASAESLLQIINDILDVSKIEAGKMRLERIPFDIVEVIKLCRIVISPKAEEKGLALYCYAEPSIGRLLIGDPTKLRQILLNLLSNAVKFTNTGVVKLLVAVKYKTENNATLHFEVKDSGIGMTPKQMSRIFHPFEQGDDSTKRKYGGTGLGLVITKKFVELMGGKLNVESGLGIGSKFSFELSFETADMTNVNLQKSSMAAIGKKPVFEGEILVCEDNDLNQQVICDHLSKVGLKTVIAENGKEGSNLVKKRIHNDEKPFDLIFMDIHMPEMDGLEAAKIITEAGSTTPIVALTANVMLNDREAYFKSGMQYCLSKPFATEELWACLLNFLTPVSATPWKNADDVEDDHNAELITTFVNSNQNTFADINNALKAGNIVLAHRLVHTLKGVAGIVGRTRLAEAALVLEQSLAADNVEYLEEKMNVLDRELNAALRELTPVMNEYLEKTSKRTGDLPLDKENLLKLLTELDILLASSSYDSIDYIKDLRMIPEMKQLTEQVENMNFRQARETLAAIKLQMEKGDG